jgi:hemoglobin
VSKPALGSADRALVDGFLSRRRVLRGALASGVALSMFSFLATPEIEAQALAGNRLYDQLGGLGGITAVMNTFVGNLASDDRISHFFTSLPAPRLKRLEELLIQQVSSASGGPVTYTGRDMQTTHAGLKITMNDFNALVEDLVAALDTNGVSAGAKQMLLGALAPLASDIVTA